MDALCQFAPICNSYKYVTCSAQSSCVTYNTLAMKYLLHISAALICMLLITAPAYANPSGTAQEQRQRAQNAREEAAAADRQAEDLRLEIQELNEAQERHAAESARLVPLVEEATERREVLDREVEELQAEVNELIDRIAETEEEIVHQRELLNQRAVSTYRGENNAMLNVLFSARDLGDFIARAENIMTILQHNSQISIDLTNLTIRLADEQEQLEEVLALAEERQAEAAEAEADLRSLLSQSQAAADSAEALQVQRTAMLANTEANAARLRALAAEADANASALQRELSTGGAASTGTGVFEGSMTWPVPGFSRISSNFGRRTSPIWGGSEFHSGVDIAGAGIHGAAVVAAGDGVVLSVGWRSSYGNTVIIDHGNGVTTLYAHLSGFNVSVGQEVSAGQRIGSVGSTGDSTGPHLHWEVRVNGSPRNPMTF